MLRVQSLTFFFSFVFTISTEIDILRFWAVTHLARRPSGFGITFIGRQCGSNNPAFKIRSITSVGTALLYTKRIRG